jgi:hypothetical protein
VALFDDQTGSGARTNPPVDLGGHGQPAQVTCNGTNARSSG